jgi:thymidylate synthase ThyX
MNNVKVVGKGGISATIIAHSKSDLDGSEIITFELEYHRYIHGEFMTHRLFSRNAASSRAIPVAKMIELVKNSPAIPVHWGKNQAGMQAKEECTNGISWYKYEDLTPTDAWKQGMYNALEVAEAFSDAGYHKQIVNRLLEPFQMIKVVVTATEWDNFFWLRFHDKAQPEIYELARCMLAAKKRSVPEVLNVGEWHVPYVKTLKFKNSPRMYCKWVKERVLDDGQTETTFEEMSLEEALHVSASCSAQVSYRKTDNSLKKCERVWQMLTTDDRLHGSPMEHQATPMECCYFYTNTDMVEYNGVTHIDKDGKGWSNNFKGWIQHRALIPNNNCTSFDYTQEIDETGLKIEDKNNGF